MSLSCDQKSTHSADTESVLIAQSLAVVVQCLLLACQLVSSYSSVLIVSSLFWIASTHCDIIRIAISCIYCLKPFNFSSHAIREAANLRTLRRITQPIEGELQQTYFHVILLSCPSHFLSKLNAQSYQDLISSFVWDFFCWLTFWMPLRFSPVIQYQLFFSSPLCGNVDYCIYPWEVLRSFWSMMLFCKIGRALTHACMNAWIFANDRLPWKSQVCWSTLPLVS